MKTRHYYFLGWLLTLVLCFAQSADGLAATRKFVHPGISYNQADIDRMRAMIEARQEPFYSGYKTLLSNSYTNYGDYKRALPTASNGQPVIWDNINLWLDTFGRIAFCNALLWRLTDNVTYADKAVAVLNRYNPVKSTISYGTYCLGNSQATMLIEAAELLCDYSGWKPADQQAFKDFLVYPGFSTREDFYAKYASSDTVKNNITIYWNIFQGDCGRHGNQGLYGMRCLMAMGIYLDNDTIYDRAYRKVMSLPHRSDDLAYPCGPRTGVKLDVSPEPDYYEEWDCSSNRVTVGNTPDYGFDDELKYWIYENGQTQEAFRDQGHIMDGLCNLAYIARTAWNQGDDLFTAYDDRLLKGITYASRYNYGWLNNNTYGGEFWQGESDWEPTIESGEFLSIQTRCGRWKGLKINPAGRGKQFDTPLQMLMDYKVILGRSDAELLWVQRACDVNAVHTDNTKVVPVDDRLGAYRTEWMAGNPVTAFDAGTPIYGIHDLDKGAAISCSLFDYFNAALSGEGRTYHYQAAGQSNDLRPEAVAIAADGGVTGLSAGDWFSYTLHTAYRQLNTFTVTYRCTASARLVVAFDHGDETVLTLPATATSATLPLLTVPTGATVLRLRVEQAGKDLTLVSFAATDGGENAIYAPYTFDPSDWTVSSAQGTLATVGTALQFTPASTSVTKMELRYNNTDLTKYVPTDKCFLVFKIRKATSAGDARTDWQLHTNNYYQHDGSNLSMDSQDKKVIAVGDHCYYISHFGFNILRRVPGMGDGKFALNPYLNADGRLFYLEQNAVQMWLATTGSYTMPTMIIDDIAFCNMTEIYERFPDLAAFRMTVSRDGCPRMTSDLCQAGASIVSTTSTAFTSGVMNADSWRILGRMAGCGDSYSGVDLSNVSSSAVPTEDPFSTLCNTVVTLPAGMSPGWENSCSAGGSVARLHLKADHPFSITEAVTADEASFSANMMRHQHAAFCLPFAVAAATNADFFSCYQYAAEPSPTLVWHLQSGVAAHTPMLVRAEVDGDVTLQSVGGSIAIEPLPLRPSVTVGDVTLSSQYTADLGESVMTDGVTDGRQHYFVVQDDGTMAGMSALSVLNPFQSWVYLPSGLPAETEFLLSTDKPTALRDLNNGSDGCPASLRYDLSGRQCLTSGGITINSGVKQLR